MISWVNPDERLAHKSFENYLLESPIVALDVVEASTGVREVNAIGYCLGGTLLAATLAYLTAKNDDRIGSATYFVALVVIDGQSMAKVFTPSLPWNNPRHWHRHVEETRAMAESMSNIEAHGGMPRLAADFMARPRMA